MLKNRRINSAIKVIVINVPTTEKKLIPRSKGAIETIAQRKAVYLAAVAKLCFPVIR